MNTSLTLLSEPPSSLSVMVRGIKGILPVFGKSGRLTPQTPIPDRTLGLDVRVDGDALAEYCDVVGVHNTGDVPVMYLFVLSFPLVMDLFLADDFPAAAVGSVHVANTIDRYREVAVGETLSLRTRAGNLREHRKGMLIDFTTEFTDAAGTKVADEVSTMLIQQRTSRSDEPAPPTPPEQSPPPAQAYLSADGALIRRYASVSGDRNPIHMSPLGGKAFGFPSSIAHGAWTAAAVLRMVEGKVPAAVRYHAKFGRPVILPAKVALYTAAVEGGTEIVARDRKKGFPHVTGTVTAL